MVALASLLSPDFIARAGLSKDPEQLQAIEAGAAFRGVIGQAGLVELTQVRRQKEAWARQATQELANGRTLEALKAYDSQGALHPGRPGIAGARMLSESGPTAVIAISSASSRQG